MCVHTKPPQFYPQDVTCSCTFNTFLGCIEVFKCTLDLSYVYINASRSQATDVSYTGNPCILGYQQHTACVHHNKLHPYQQQLYEKCSHLDKVSLSLHECRSCSFAPGLCIAILYYASVRFPASFDLNWLNWTGTSYDSKLTGQR